MKTDKEIERISIERGEKDGEISRVKEIV